MHETIKIIKLYCKTLHEAFTWHQIRRKYNIDENTVVVALPEKHCDWNEIAIKYLPDYIKRKNADRAVVLVVDETIVDKRRTECNSDLVLYRLIEPECLKKLMKYYSLHRFFDKIVFFYLEYPKDNKSSFILNSTEVTMDELVCLGFYRLREVPSHV